GGGIDTKKNKVLDQIIKDALSSSVPKQTIERVIDRFKDENMAIYHFQGHFPGGLVVLFEGKSYNGNRLLCDLRSVSKKLMGEVRFCSDNDMIFKKSSYIRAKLKENLLENNDMLWELGMQINCDDIEILENDQFVE
ncbi:MAG: hypothetical protein MHPSP_004359, partial [Paramarteilia canceri]